MKIRYLAMLAAVATFGAAACNDDEETEGLTLSAYTYEVDQAGGSEIITVHSSSDWTAVSSADWAVSGITDAVKAQKTTKITVEENLGDARTATITFTNATETAVLTITQEELAYTMEADSTLEFGYKGGTLTLNINTTRDWSVSSDASWLSFSPSSADQSTTSTSVTAEAMSTTDATRTATITITTANGTATVAVTQNAYVTPETASSLEEAIGTAGSGTAVRVEERVAAVSTDAIVLADDSYSLVIRNLSNPLDYTIGDLVEICGTVTYDDRVACISDIDIEEKLSDGEVSDAVYPSPVRMFKVNVNYFAGLSELYPRFGIFTGQLTVEDGEYKLAIPTYGTNYSSELADGIIYNPTSDQTAQLDALDGNYIALTGFLVGYTDENVMNIIPLDVADRTGDNAFWTPVYGRTHSGTVTFPVTDGDYLDSEFSLTATNGDPWVWMDEIPCPPDGQVLEFEYKSNIHFYITIYWLAKFGDGPNPAYLYPGEDQDSSHEFQASSDWQTARLDCTGNLPSLFGYGASARLDLGWDSSLEISIRNMHWTD
jgi:hypothetical protein